MFWQGGIYVTIHDKLKNYIDLVIKEDDGRSWHFTGIYGEPHADSKHETWLLLRNLHNHYANDPLMWLCAGDFNKILYHHEKEGGAV